MCNGKNGRHADSCTDMRGGGGEFAVAVVVGGVRGIEGGRDEVIFIEGRQS